MQMSVNDIWSCISANLRGEMLQTVINELLAAFIGKPGSENISNNPGFRLKHPGVPDGSEGSDGTSYPLTENYTVPVAQATGRIAQHSTCERQRQTCERLGAPRITVEHSGKNNIWERCWCAWNS